MSNIIRAAIKKHLSAQTDSWASTVSKVSAEVGMGPIFVENDMKAMIEDGEIIPIGDTSVPQYQAPGASEGKYSGFNQKRLEAEKKLEGMENPTTRDGFNQEDPRKKSIGNVEGV